jgi:hypothetical protein
MVLYSNLVYSALSRRSSSDGRKIAMDAMAASIAHEVNQPIAAMTFNSEAALILLAGTPPNIEEARAALDAIVSDGARAGAVVASLRCSSGKPTNGYVSTQTTCFGKCSSWLTPICGLSG